MERRQRADRFVGTPLALERERQKKLQGSAIRPTTEGMPQYPFRIGEPPDVSQRASVGDIKITALLDRKVFFTECKPSLIPVTGLTLRPGGIAYPADLNPQFSQLIRFNRSENAVN